MNIPKEIINIRKLNKMNQTDLANACGCSVSQIRNIEKGRGTPSVQLLEKIASATGSMLVVTFVEQ